MSDIFSIVIDAILNTFPKMDYIEIKNLSDKIANKIQKEISSIGSNECAIVVDDEGHIRFFVPKNKGLEDDEVPVPYLLMLSIYLQIGEKDFVSDMLEYIRKLRKEKNN